MREQRDAPPAFTLYGMFRSPFQLKTCGPWPNPFQSAVQRIIGLHVCLPAALLPVVLWGTLEIINGLSNSAQQTVPEHRWHPTLGEILLSVFRNSSELYEPTQAGRYTRTRVGWSGKSSRACVCIILDMSAGMNRVRLSPALVFVLGGGSVGRFPLNQQLEH